MSASKRWVSAEVEQLLDLFLAAATEINRPYAIGGALVMGVHGYRRHTDDVDAYVNHVDRVEWVRALRKQGLTVTPLFSGVHYIALLPEHNDPEIRIDLMVPAEDPDLSAIEVPDSATIADRAVEVWPLDLLVIAKFRSTRSGDRSDVDRMFELGIFNPKSVRSIMLRINETSSGETILEKIQRRTMTGQTRRSPTREELSRTLAMYGAFTASGRILDGDDQDTLGHLRRLRAKLTDDERGEARRSIG
jgi:hypothetical protein